MAKKLDDLTLDELYSKEKISPTAARVIATKENFTKISERYCEKVCTLPHKECKRVTLRSNAVDVLIIASTFALPELDWNGNEKDTFNIDIIHENIIQGIIKSLDNWNNYTYRVTRALKCKLSRRSVPKNQPPSISTIKKCSPYLLSEIRESKPKVIISLDTDVSRILGIKKSNYTNRGEIHLSSTGIPVILTLHPKQLLMIRQNSSGLFWGPDYLYSIAVDFGKVHGIISGTIPVGQLERSIERLEPAIGICRSLEDVGRVIRDLEGLPEHSIVSFDIETTGLDPWEPGAKILCIQFGFNGRAYVIPLWHRENNFYDPDEAWKLVSRYLKSDHGKMAHGGSFDIKYIFATTGVRVNGIVNDTLLLLHSINSGLQGNYSLKTAVWDYLPELGIGGYEDILKISDISEEVNEEPDV
jgi:hypothetical protein